MDYEAFISKTLKILTLCITILYIYTLGRFNIIGIVEVPSIFEATVFAVRSMLIEFNNNLMSEWRLTPIILLFIVDILFLKKNNREGKFIKFFSKYIDSKTPFSKELSEIRQKNQEKLNRKPDELDAQITGRHLEDAELAAINAKTEYDLFIIVRTVHALFLLLFLILMCPILLIFVPLFVWPILYQFVQWHFSFGEKVGVKPILSSIMIVGPLLLLTLPFSYSLGSSASFLKMHKQATNVSGYSNPIKEIWKPSHDFLYGVDCSEKPKLVFFKEDTLISASVLPERIGHKICSLD